MRVLITGGSGFIASHFYAPLATAGHEVVSYDVLPPSAQATSVAHRQADVRDGDQLASALVTCDAVLHLAAAHHDVGVPDHTYFDVNGRGAEILCGAMDRAGIKNVCFYSSVAVYGDVSPPRDESAEPRPISSYGRSKLAAERAFAQWVAKGDGRRCLVIRPAAVIGPRHFANMYSLIRQIDSGRFIPAGTLQNRKSLAHVENLVEGTLCLWLEHPELCRAFDVFNYCDKPDLRSAEIVEHIYRGLGRRPPSRRVPFFVADAASRVCDLMSAATGWNPPITSARLHKFAKLETTFAADKVFATGFRPRAPLVDGLQQMVVWYQDEGKNTSPSTRPESVGPLLSRHQSGYPRFSSSPGSAHFS